MPSSTEAQLIPGSPSNSNWSDGSADAIDGGPAAAPDRDSLHRDRDLLDLESVADSPPPPTGNHRVSRQDASMELEAEARHGLWRLPPPFHGPWPLPLHGPPHGRPSRPSPPSAPSPAAAPQRLQALFVDPQPHPRPLAIPGPPGFPALPPNAGTLPHLQQGVQVSFHFHFHGPHHHPSPFVPRNRDPRREWAAGGAAMDRRASPYPPPPPIPPRSPEGPPSHGDGRL